MKTDVLEFNNLVLFHDGKVAKEKTYHAKINGLDVGCTMWCAWNEKKNRWSRWHVYYFFQNDNTLYSDPISFHQLVEDRSLSVSRKSASL